MNKTCLTCGIEFKGATGRKYCSMLCYGKSRLGKRVSPLTEFKKGTKTPTPFLKGHCPWNKGIKTGLVPRSAFKKGQVSPRKGVHLSEETKRKLSIAKSGANSWTWKGGITPTNVLERARFHRTVKKEVLKRDNYKCIFCNSNNDLTVDHILPWSRYPEKRFDIKNCRTLCKSCHYYITFGRSIPNKHMAWGHTYKEVAV